MGELESPRQRLGLLSVRSCIYKHALEMERRRLRLLVLRDLYGEEAVARARLSLQRGVAASHDDLHAVVSKRPWCITSSRCTFSGVCSITSKWSVIRVPTL